MWGFHICHELDRCDPLLLIHFHQHLARQRHALPWIPPPTLCDEEQIETVISPLWRRSMFPSRLTANQRMLLFGINEQIIEQVEDLLNIPKPVTFQDLHGTISNVSFVSVFLIFGLAWQQISVVVKDSIQLRHHYVIGVRQSRWLHDKKWTDIRYVPHRRNGWIKTIIPTDPLKQNPLAFWSTTRSQRDGLNLTVYQNMFTKN